MEEAQTNYNFLYPKPSEKLSIMLNEFISSNAKVNLGTYEDVGAKLLFPLLIKKCLKIYNKSKCSGCTGTHQYVIAGGYASYLANLTKTFTDIDIYVDCHSLVDQATITQTNYKIKTTGVVSTISYHNKPKVQFVQVTFDLGKLQINDHHTHRQCMAMYVVDKFDLPICRVAAFVSLSKEIKLAYLINASSFDIYKTPTTEARRLKYEERKNNFISYSAPSLQLCILFNLFNNHVKED